MLVGMGGGASKSKKKSSTAALATAEAPPAATAPAASDPSVSDADVTPGTPATKHISAPIPWEQVIKVTRADLNLSPPPPLDSDLAVSLRGVPGYEHLNGTGAKIIQAMGNDTWRVQPGAGVVRLAPGSGRSITGLSRRPICRAGAARRRSSPARPASCRSPGTSPDRRSRRSRISSTSSSRRPSGGRPM